MWRLFEKKHSNVSYVESILKKKWLTTQNERGHHQNESNSNNLEKTKLDNVNNNHNNRTLLLGPSFSGKTHLMLTINYVEYVIEIFT